MISVMNDYNWWFYKSAATDAGILCIFVLFGKALKLKGLGAAVKLMLCDHEVMSSLLQKQKCR
jgi:hypothetical protein